MEDDRYYKRTNAVAPARPARLLKKSVSGKDGPGRKAANANEAVQ